MTKLLTILILLIPAIAHAEQDEWSTHQIVMEVVFVGLVYNDVQQTKVIIANGGYENNIVIGKYPTNAELDQWGIIAIITQSTIAHFLSSELRTSWIWYTGIVEFFMIVNNRTVIGKVGFNF